MIVNDAPPVILPRSLNEQTESLHTQFQNYYPNVTPRYLIKVPLRICPLGAHSDHQGGIVTGCTIDRPLLLMLAPSGDSTVRLRSANFENEVSFDLRSIPPKISGDWGNYARGAALALQQYTTTRGAPPAHSGFVGAIASQMPVGGLSSSAAVTLAYLKALQTINDIESSPIEDINLVLATENGYLGLNNGILDQGVIVSSRPHALTTINCQTLEIDSIPMNAKSPPWEILVVYSGLSRNLVSTPFNQRVAECREAAKLLLAHAGVESTTPPRLRDVSEAQFEAWGPSLPAPLHRRAKHFFSEYARVCKGIEEWRRGNIEAFGALISQSGLSSIENYESGSPALIALYEILSSLPGVYGARFCGGGFQGCALAFINPEHREAIITALHHEYMQRHPELREHYSIHLCKSSGTVEVIDL